MNAIQVICRGALAVLVLCAASSVSASNPNNENENDEKKTSATNAALVSSRVQLVSGNVVGFVFKNESDKQQPVAAKVTLSVDGRTIDTVNASETGEFQFLNVIPGTYTITGSTGDLAGSQVIEVGEFQVSDAAYTSLPLEVTPVAFQDGMVMGDAYAGAPVGALGGPVYTDAGACGGCGGGGYSGGGCGGGFGRLLPLAGLAGLFGLLDPAPVSPAGN